MPAGIPDRIGKYELRGTLGRGAMGTVYDGWDPGIGRRVAIKTVRLADARADEETAEALERFRREAQAAGRLSHANIVGVFDTGETDELAYIVMEFIEGRSLKEVLDANKSLPPDEAAEIMGQVLAGLEYSHRRGVIHRDIKPANVMLTGDGLVKLADFGIARIASSNATAVGVIMGTPAYMPPEQFLGDPADARSDIYAAGAMLFHLLTGTRPYEGNPTSIMHRVLNAPAPPPPSERSVSVSPAWDAVIARAMAKRPEDRFQTASAFGDAVRQAASGAVPVAEEDATMIASPPRRAPATPNVRAQAASEAMPALKRAAGGPLLLGAGVVGAAVAAAAAWFLLSPRHAGPVALQQPLPAAPSRPVPLPPPTPEAASPSPPQQPAPMSPEVVLAALAAATADLPCSLVDALAPTGPGTGPIVLAGMAGHGAPLASVSNAARSAHWPGQVVVNVKSFDGPYCSMLDVLRPVIRGAKLDFSVPEASQPVHALEHEHPSILHLPFAAWVQVDYFSGDGTVFHVLPIAATKSSGFISDPSRLLPAGSELRLGEPPHNILIPGTPFGTDMFTAIASSEPLFSAPRREGETDAAYVTALRTAMERVRAHGGRLAAAATLVSTVKK